MITNGESPMPNAPRRVDVLVIGAGCSGIGAAIRLRREGIDDFVVLEKGADLGGTWRENTYPGCACDVPSALYSYSFAPNPAWTRAFAGQAEIFRYLRRVAIDHGVMPRISFETEVTRATWSDADTGWHVDTTRGAFLARVVVSAAGPLHTPDIPDLPGLATFRGKVFHSAEWDHTYDLAGKRVAVVGTGASAIQFVPKIQPLVAKLHLFQRTPSWVLPKPDHRVAALEQRLFTRFPRSQVALRRAEYGLLEALAFGFRHPRVMRAVQRLGLVYLRSQVKDEALRRALTPKFVLGCKRILLSNTYLRAVASPNVELHATAVSRIDAGAARGADGSLAEVDALIFGTGFHVTDPPVAERIVGARGKSLAEEWRGSPRGYLGTSIVGFPNFFMMLGPNLGTGHSSAFSIIEAQLDQIVSAVTAMRARSWARLDVRPDVEAAYNDEVQGALAQTVYNAGGCASYYLDANGRNSTIWPWSTTRLVKRVGAFQASAYDAR
jgi:cation diffusion facilitator CzcD-associated flavoprotein CzcO